MAVKTKDYYDILGVARSATGDQIKTAYRKLARKFHPDLNPTDKAAEGRFKEVQHAYDVLSNAEDRKLYDEYGENWQAVKQGGGPQPPGSGDFRGTSQPGGPTPGGFNFSDFDFGGFGSGSADDIFEMFGRAGRRPTRRSNHGQDIEAELELALEDAHRGVRTSLQLKTTETCPTCHGTGVVKDNKICPTCGGMGQVVKPRSIEVKIPAGARDGSTIRLAGQGGAGFDGGKPGDLYLHIRLRPHRLFTVRGDDLEIELPIAPWEAVLGTKVDTPTIDGKVEVNIPAGSQTNQRLRLKGQGLNKRKGGRGDELVRLKIVAPKHVTEQERKHYEELRSVSKFDPRAELGK